jgi:hypothetical protein
VADILGRHAEHEDVDQLFVRAQAETRGVLVVCGEAGIGKTTLKQHESPARARGYQEDPGLAARPRVPISAATSTNSRAPRVAS